MAEWSTWGALRQPVNEKAHWDGVKRMQTVPHGGPGECWLARLQKRRVSSSRQFCLMTKEQLAMKAGSGVPVCSSLLQPPVHFRVTAYFNLNMDVSSHWVTHRKMKDRDILLYHYLCLIHTSYWSLCTLWRDDISNIPRSQFWYINVVLSLIPKQCFDLFIKCFASSSKS